MALGVASPWRSRFEPSARTQEGAEAEDGDRRSARGRPGQLGSVRRGNSASVAELARAKARIEELERLVGRQQLDLDFFRKALRLADALQGPAPARGETNSSRSSKI